MRRLQRFLTLLVMIFCLALAGCGGSSSGDTPRDVFNNGPDNGGGPIFGIVGDTGISLTATPATVDNNGQVLVTARVVKNGAKVQGLPITFSVVAPVNGPAEIESGMTTVSTDTNGEAITRITTGNATSTTNVIVSATATVGTQPVKASTTFQIVRGTGIIAIGELPVKSATVDPNIQTSQVFQQQIPIKLTDATGFARVGTPVTLSLYNQTSSSSVLISQTTINTDSSGLAIFNATVTMTAPAPGLTAVDSVIYKATTSDAAPIVAYVAGYYSITSTTPSITDPTMILTTDSAAYDINDGSVLATAKIARNGAPVSGVSVTFSITEPTNGPATIETGLTTVTTDSNGLAVTRIRTGNVTSTTNVIMRATATIGGNPLNATATFQIVPPPTVEPIIILSTDRSTYDVTSGTVVATAKVVKNGVAVSGAPVTFSITAPTNGPATIEAGMTTVSTDSNGIAVTRIKPGTVSTPTNVIVSAAATVSTQIITATTTFLIVPDLTQPSIVLTTDHASYDVNSKAVLATARIVKNGLAVAGVPVTFSITAPVNGPATIESGLTTVITDSNGMAVTRITAGSVATPTNVIISAAATVISQPINATTTFMIVPDLTQPSITLATDRAAYDVNSKTVLATARIVKNGAGVAGVPVTFSITAPVNGPATIEPGMTTVTTDSNGVAITRITAGTVATSTNVIVNAAATVGAQPINATTSFSIVPDLTQPSITLATDRSTYDVTSGTVLATAKIVKNGAAIAGVPVTFSITAPTNGPATIESGLTTVTTDSNGIAVTRITTGNTSSPTNVILKAEATVAPQTISATTTFMVVPDITQPSILLTTDRTSYDVNSGPVTATTKIIKNGVAVFGVPVTYSVLTGPVTLVYRTPTTDRNGSSIATLTVDDSTRATTNTILQATATVDGTTYIAYAQFTVNGFDPTAAPAPTVNVTLTADRTEVDANNGTVMLNANLFYGSDYLYQGALIARGTSVPNQPVTFTVLSGPPGTTISGSTLQTDKNGNAKAILTTGNAQSTTNVIVEASTLFDDGKTYRAYTTIQIVRGGGVIMFTSAAGLPPMSQSNMLDPYAGKTDSSFTPSVTVVQLIPFKLTDSNGNPRVNVPVTLSTHNISPLTSPPGVIVNYSTVSEAGQQTIFTDSAGMGIFNISVSIASPPPGSFTARTVVFKAVTNDTIPVTAYVGRSYSLTSPTAP